MQQVLRTAFAEKCDAELAYARWSSTQTPERLLAAPGMTIAGIFARRCTAMAAQKALDFWPGSISRFRKPRRGDGARLAAGRGQPWYRTMAAQRPGQRWLRGWR